MWFPNAGLASNQAPPQSLRGDLQPRLVLAVWCPRRNMILFCCPDPPRGSSGCFISFISNNLCTKWINRVKKVFILVSVRFYFSFQKNLQNKQTLIYYLPLKVKQHKILQPQPKRLAFTNSKHLSFVKLLWFLSVMIRSVLEEGVFRYRLVGKLVLYEILFLQNLNSAFLLPITVKSFHFLTLIIIVIFTILWRRLVSPCATRRPCAAVPLILDNMLLVMERAVTSLPPSCCICVFTH